ncbi:YcbX family protein [Aliiglaciecola sp. 2_MG-2023]|uniref:YcbX family protein n=1 Tax=unclassified Aliiglaciecola TaxID=2593648 RepID=UPI0026E46B56|nr:MULTISPECIES: YcbX family protein [unclassified Aliiglaciecola]MDO6711766.1 YcbX family protein [Aliiglaciecola sp. 2_MG-2023]MDO6752837.1 YcbX family protein [Aliiglaciecola sp. 1_MG-2023]
MPQLTLSQINIYPIKSCAGISLSSSKVEQMGLESDRRFVLTQTNGTFITARTDSTLCLVQTEVTATGLRLNAPGMPELIIKYAEFSEKYQTVKVWEDDINGQYCDPIYDHWFSQFLGKPCKLVFFGEQSKRRVKNSDSEVSFADGYPFLVISQQSLNDLNSRLATPVTMSQFRPNLVIDNCAPFEEDNWKKIRIGEVEFEIMKSCSRCIFTTVDPITGEKNPQLEPLSTLQKYRKDKKGDVLFGQNLIALNSGNLSLNDEVVVTERQTRTIHFDLGSKPARKAGRSPIQAESTEQSAIKSVEIAFSSWNVNHQGDNQTSILEQGEAAGLNLPYSCRAGICGRCKVKLNSGQVKNINELTGLTEQQANQGYILACSCVPQTDVEITKA